MPALPSGASRRRCGDSSRPRGPWPGPTRPGGPARRVSRRSTRPHRRCRARRHSVRSRHGPRRTRRGPGRRRRAAMQPRLRPGTSGRGAAVPASLRACRDQLAGLRAEVPRTARSTWRSCQARSKQSASFPSACAVSRTPRSRQARRRKQIDGSAQVAFGGPSGDIGPRAGLKGGPVQKAARRLGSAGCCGELAGSDVKTLHSTQFGLPALPIPDLAGRACAIRQ